MHSGCWQLADRRAQLSVGEVQASIDLDEPAAGLSRVLAAQTELFEWRLLGVQLPPAIPAGLPAHAYIRQADLIATYEESDAYRYRTQMDWRASQTDQATGDSPASSVELVVSQQTTQLDVHHPIDVASRVEATAALHLRNAARGQFDVLVVDGPQTLEFTPEHGPGCWLFRLAGCRLSYGQMVHPADDQRAVLRVVGDASGRPGERRMELAHRLCGSWFEKGVILRSRVLGVFLPRQDDAHQLAEIFGRFAASAPPLTT